MIVFVCVQDINSPTDSVIGRDFQELSAEEQERQREEWKAELKKTEEEILTLKQVLTAKEHHAAGEERYRSLIKENMREGETVYVTVCMEPTAAWSIRILQVSAHP